MLFELAKGKFILLYFICKVCFGKSSIFGINIFSLQVMVMYVRQKVNYHCYILFICYSDVESE